MPSRRSREFASAHVKLRFYYFDEYDPSTGDATALCNRLGIPLTDEIVIEFPIERTFDPLPESQIADLSKQLGASLPSDYICLLMEFGAFHLPGDCCDIALLLPNQTISLSKLWGLKDPAITPVMAISHYNVDCDGDAIGFIRSGESFGPELYTLRHELRFKNHDLQDWTVKLADSLSEFVVSYIDSLL